MQVGAPVNWTNAKKQVLTPRDEDLNPEIWTEGHPLTKIIFLRDW